METVTIITSCEVCDEGVEIEHDSTHTFPTYPTNYMFPNGEAGAFCERCIETRTPEELWDERN